MAIPRFTTFLKRKELTVAELKRGVGGLGPEEQINKADLDAWLKDKIGKFSSVKVVDNATKEKTTYVELGGSFQLIDGMDC